MGTFSVPSVSLKDYDFWDLRKNTTIQGESLNAKPWAVSAPVVPFVSACAIGVSLFSAASNGHASKAISVSSGCAERFPCSTYPIEYWIRLSPTRLTARKLFRVAA